MKNFIYLFAILLLAVACKDAPQLMPNVSGKAGEVVVVADKVYVDGEFGKAIREVLTADYPAIPQSEPLFDLSIIPWTSYTRMFEPFRNQIKLRISHEYTEAKMTIQHDVYAAPQLVINFSGPDEESVVRLVYEEQARIVELLEQAERNRVLIGAKKYQNVEAFTEVEKHFGGSPIFPAGFKATKLKNDKFIWLTSNNRSAMLNIMVYSYPYTGPQDFELQNMMDAENKVLQANMPSSEEGSYMKISPAELPSMRFMRYNDIHFAELRGLWEVEKGFMGGPFVSHSFLDKEGENIIVLTAFVYAPSKEKRNFIRQTDALLYSWEWAKTSEKN